MDIQNLHSQSTKFSKQYKQLKRKKRFQTIVASAKQKFSLSISSVKLAVVATAICCLTPINAFADKVGDYNAGITALGEVEKSLKDYIEPVTKVCYALAGIVAIIGAISVYIAMSASVMVA